jgi:hypothetical protein
MKTDRVNQRDAGEKVKGFFYFCQMGDRPTRLDGDPVS